MAHFSLSIDPYTNDLHLDGDGNLATVRDAEAVAQHVRQRLLTFHGEWFLDTEAGVEWLNDLLGSRYNPELANSLTKEEILDTDGVTDISTFSTSFDRETRGVEIKNIEVETIYDEEAQV